MKRKYSKKTRKKSIYVSNKQVGLNDWLPPVKRSMKSINTNSWFDMKYFHNPNRSSCKKYKINVPIIPPDSYKQQMKAIKLRKSNKRPIFISCKKVRLYPTNNQKFILQQWFDAFGSMFNHTINYVRSKIFKNKKLIDHKQINKILNFRNIRKQLYDSKMNIQKTTKNSPIPIHILDEAIHQAVSNYKTCFTNFKNGHIKKFRVREWSRNRRRKIIKIESSFFKNNTFCQSIFPKMKASSSLKNITSTVTLQYNKDTHKYILFVPIGNKIKRIEKRELSAGIDLGVRTFGAVYCQNGVYNFCNDSVRNKYIYKYHRKIDKINELLQMDEKTNIVTIRKKINNEIITDLTVKTIKKQGLLKALRKYHLKIKNKITDMHFKVAYKLVNAFDNIYIGKLSTKKILSKNNIKITRSTKRMLGVLSPYLFRQRLIYIGYKYGCWVSEEDEYLTTITCSSCGTINKIGQSKIYKCRRCGLEADRDEQSGKNILKVGLHGQKERPW